MASVLYQEFVKKAKSARATWQTMAEANAWFRKEAVKVTSGSISGRTLFTATGEDAVGKLTPTNKKFPKYSFGQMVLYYYDPKWKKTLPYYDRLPLIFYLCEKPGKLGPGFLGLNLHYLPPRERALLLDAIYTTAEKTRNNEMKRVKITYNILKGMSKYYKPCVKHYLYGHIRSKFLVVAPSEWEKVCFLPIEQFEKASKRKVWRDSLGKI